MTIQSSIGVPLLGDFSYRSYRFGRRYFTLKVPKIFIKLGFVVLAPWPSCRQCQSAAQCTCSSGIRGRRSALADSRTGPRNDCGSNLAAGFCMYRCRHRDNCNFFSVITERIHSPDVASLLFGNASVTSIVSVSTGT